jgi:hypothetical protein
VSVEPASRCVLHPGRVAADHCPVCERLRCAEDAATHGSAGCGICVSAPARRPPATISQVLVGAGLAALPGMFIGGAISADYIRDHIFSLVVPALVGISACWPALVVLHRSGRSGAQLRRLTLAVSVFAAVCGVLGTGFGFRLDPGGPPQIVSPLHLVGGPYLSAALAGLFWPFVYGGPKRSNPEA